MKTLILFFALLFCSLSSFAGTDKIVKDTTIHNVKYTVYEGTRGGRYIFVTSKTGKVYKKYFPKS